MPIRPEMPAQPKHRSERRHPDAFLQISASKRFNAPNVPLGLLTLFKLPPPHSLGLIISTCKLWPTELQASFSLILGARDLG